MNLADVERRLIRRHGTGVTPWVAGLPARLDSLAAAWDLVLGEPFGSGNSAVAVRARRDGLPVVLKVSPDEEFAGEQAAVLRAFEPSGRVPRVLAAEGGAMLLEHVDGEARWPSPAEFGALLADLHAAVPDPRAVARRDLRFWTTEFQARFPPTGPVTADDLAASRAACATLADTAGPHVLLHGDLHADNVIAGTRVVVIDPKACLGEPEFDAADYVLAGPGIPARRDALLDATALRPDRLDGWCRALAPLVAVGAARRGLPTDELLAYARGAH